jgi:hypothetical protein
LLKRSNGREQAIDGAKFLACVQPPGIRIWASEIPLAPVEIAWAEQERSRPEQSQQQAGARQTKKSTAG